MSDEMMWSEGEQEDLCQGDWDLERAKYQREIDGLKRQLADKDRMARAVEEKHSKELHKTQDEVTKLKKLNSAYETGKYGGDVVLPTLVENAAAMVIVMEDIAAGGQLGGTALNGQTKTNNLRLAIRDWARQQLKVGDTSIYELLTDPNFIKDFGYKERVLQPLYKHLNEVFDVSGTHVASWDKGADPSVHPIVLESLSSTNEDTTDGDETEEEEGADGEAEGYNTFIYNSSGDWLAIDDSPKLEISNVVLKHLAKTTAAEIDAEILKGGGDVD